MLSAEIQQFHRLTDNTISHRNTENVIVAVRADNEISRTALAWALAHVVRPGDSITILAVVPGQNRGKKLWILPRFAGDCASRHRKSSPDRRCQISESCSQMVLQFHGVCDPNQIDMKIKVVSATTAGVVAAECKRAGANWVVLDKQLKHEQKHCMEELQCNIVAIKRSQPKVLRLNLCELHEPEPPFSSPESDERPQESRIKHSTPISSHNNPKSSTFRTSNQASLFSSHVGYSPFHVCERNPLFEGFYKGESSFRAESVDFEDAATTFDSDGEGSGSSSLHPLLDTARQRAYGDSSTFNFERSRQNQSSNPTSSSAPYHSHKVYWIPQNNMDDQKPAMGNYITTVKTKFSTAKTLLERFAEFDGEAGPQRVGLDLTHRGDYVFNSNVREVVSLCRSSASIPPPLCSICQHKVPVFGKPPRWFSYRELEDATDGFSELNFLAVGGFGSVHRGVLRDGQMVAVKQLKVSSSQGDAEFCAEVEVLSCAQHRNVVMLIGFCIEGKRRVLVYEYICNGSLDFHLYGSSRPPLDWHARVKIASGTARGLRYLHEDCRVGCIVHRDMRPKNILVTHDFEPLVGDFGLARWHPDGELAVETRVIGTFGYLAPEYAESGKISEKADVYAFGVVLLELITGRKAVDMTRRKGQQLLAEWARPVLALEEGGQPMVFDRLLDPRLQLHMVPHQLHAMARAAAFCLCRDPDERPSMSKILRVLEGDTFTDRAFDMDSVGSRSGRMNGFLQETHGELRGSHSPRLSHEALKRLYAEKSLMKPLL
ncbi:inactive protein kinase-like protein isoform X2 [Cinnamomum micranthum f. kanehirae]|uniref:Inactive protein kinase-like protein isoform X2 n=1 Tax=Cinnamomum micranthum f. kanehirae TaxID=337451 RepID=A0A3S3QCH9_9MAGN|nr:inactive protein kinase-like protein isoform X2 [Cinnamomum micranthum f. kanehirae]